MSLGDRLVRVRRVHSVEALTDGDRLAVDEMGENTFRGAGAGQRGLERRRGIDVGGGAGVIQSRTP